MLGESEHAKEKRAGLRYWMQRTLREARDTARDPATEAVHDLRVSLRRCRSLACGLSSVDADKTWRDMRHASRKLFRRLGALRDLHVLQEWTVRLADEADPV